MYKVYGGLAGKLVYDVGANIGQWSKWFREQGAEVVSIEPQEACTRENPNFKDCRIVNKCLSDKEGKIPFFEADVNTIATCSVDWVTKGRFRGSPWKSSSWKEATTLDSLFKEYGVPHLIKMDVEGYEYKVLLGMMLAPQIISLEYHQEMIDVAVECLYRLREMGFAFVTFIPECKEQKAHLCKIDDAFGYLRALPRMGWGDMVIK